MSLLDDDMPTAVRRKLDDMTLDQIGVNIVMCGLMKELCTCDPTAIDTVEYLAKRFGFETVRQIIGLVCLCAAPSPAPPPGTTDTVPVVWVPPVNDVVPTPNAACDDLPAPVTPEQLP